MRRVSTSRPASARLANRTCLVSGSTGIGAASAVRLASEGATVFVASRTAAHVERLVGEIRAVGGGGRIHELTTEGWDRTIELNLRSQALVSRAVVRRMLGQEPNPSGTRGSIVLVSSVLATRPVPELFGTHAYAAAKGAIVSLAIAMAATYAEDLIRVNVLAPGLTATPMADRAAQDPATLAFVRRKQPLAGGLVDAIDVANAAAFLLSDEARAVTGQVLGVDGGWSVVSAGATDGEPHAEGGG
jgi:NAD(P)-dependent dehydrogenase (short-subunit alcohol dehydrogenase family)